MKDEKLNSLYQKAVDALIRSQSETDLIKSLAEDADELRGIKKGDFIAQAKALYKEDTDDKILKLEELKDSIKGIEIAGLVQEYDVS